MTAVETTCLVDEKGIEILVAWTKNGGIDLISVEVVIAGHGIDILPVMKQSQYDAICEEINETI